MTAAAGGLIQELWIRYGSETMLIRLTYFLYGLTMHNRLANSLRNPFYICPQSPLRCSSICEGDKSNHHVVANSRCTDPRVTGPCAPSGRTTKFHQSPKL